MARDTWFETVAFCQEAARKRLPKSVYSSLVAASERGVTVADNVDAFAQLGFPPHVIGAFVERAREAGAVGLIVTTDWSFSHGRDWGSPTIPEEMNLQTTVRMLPEGLTRPRWFLQWAKTRRPPNLRVPNQAPRGEPGPAFFAAYGEWMGTPPPTWEDIAWLRELWGGPFMLKGVMRVDDAKHAVDAGVSAISVSNHGGNNLDGTPAAIRALPAIAAAVGHEV